ncbi:DUF4142 domain-containing protein [Acidipila sp. EB88]|uniref:DUF4142 domain-containing protein n=1 Tax=Acidipila sp. EB88 TaxID=2305226 RepID=UPI0013155826|nr:DUF4142 domain-containing protein [Acidipila sp. EB88]
MKNQTRRCITPSAVALALALSAGIAAAQTGGTSQPAGAASQPNAPGQANGANTMNSMPNNMNMGSSTMASSQDKMFLKEASEGDMFEIKASQLALQKSSSDDVKQYAQMMIDDHTKLDNAMKPIASEAGVSPATDLGGKQKKEYAKLDGLSGDAFDKEYIKVMVMDHSKVSKAFGMEASNGQLADEKNAAAQNKPTVDMHLQKAQQLAQTHNVPAGGM